MPGLLYGSHGRMKNESKVEMPLTAVAPLKFCLYFILSGCLLITWTLFFVFQGTSDQTLSSPQSLPGFLPVCS